MKQAVWTLAASLAVLLGCGQRSTEGGWTGTENGLQAQIEGPAGAVVDKGRLLSIPLSQLQSHVENQSPVEWDTLHFEGNQIVKVWEDSVPRLMWIQTDLGDWMIADSRDADAPRIQVSGRVIAAGYAPLGFGRVRSLQGDLSDSLDGAGLFVFDKIAPGTHWMLLERQGEWVFGGKVVVDRSGINPGLNLWSCPQNPAWDGAYDVWDLGSLKPVDTLSQSALGQAPQGPVAVELRGKDTIISPQGPKWSLQLPSGTYDLRFRGPKGMDACVRWTWK
jgi:hypothetical protein